MEKLIQSFKSRKFLLAVFGAIFLAVFEAVGLDLAPETVAGFSGLIVAFILGEAKIDADAVKANASKYVQALEAELSKVIASNMALTEEVQTKAAGAISPAVANVAAFKAFKAGKEAGLEGNSDAGFTYPFKQ